MGTDIHGFLQTKVGERWGNEGEIEDERNYLVFAILAGVRNGFGFAGVPTHSPVTPISEPRGLPEELGKKDFDSECEPWDFGDHSQSWLYLSEVLEWPHWNNSVVMQGYVDRDEWDKMVDEVRNPKSWCGGISGPRVVHTTSADVRNGTAPDNWTHVLHHWDARISDRTEIFRKWLDYVSAKWAWLMDRDPKSVRIVFGFDS